MLAKHSTEELESKRNVMTHILRDTPTFTSKTFWGGGIFYNLANNCGTWFGDHAFHIFRKDRIK